MSESEEIMWNSDSDSENSDSESDYDMFDPDNYTPTRKEDIAFNIKGAMEFWDSNNEKGTIIRKVFTNSIEFLEKKEETEPKPASCDIDQWDIIRILTDKNNKTLSFIDCGLGMTKKELEGFGSGDLARDLLLMADKVVVMTKHDGEDEHVMVLSPEQDNKKIVVATEQDPHLLFRGTRRGTKVTLFLKQDKVEDLLEFTTYRVLADLCFSTKINYYIFLFSTEGDVVSVTGFEPNTNSLFKGSYDINSPINYWDP